MADKMFCYQCEQTVADKGCTTVGVCGKSPEVAALQDTLTHAIKGLAQYAVEGRKVGVTDTEVNVFTAKALFTTMTNVDFDPERFPPLINKCVELRESLKSKITAAGGNADLASAAATFQPAGTTEGLARQAAGVGFAPDDKVNEDIRSLQHTLIFGLRGVAAYADHAAILGQKDDSVYAFIHEGLAATLNPDLVLNDWVSLLLKCGEINLRTMELLDAGHTTMYGGPEPTRVSLGARKGKAILISGHDLKDLADLLEQTEGKGINSIPTEKCCRPTGIRG